MDHKHCGYCQKCKDIKEHSLKMRLPEYKAYTCDTCKKILRVKN